MVCRRGAGDVSRTLAIAYHMRENRAKFIKKVRKQDNTGRTDRRNALMRIAREHFNNLPMAEQDVIISSSAKKKEFGSSGVLPAAPEVASSAMTPEVKASAVTPGVAASARKPEVAASARAKPPGDTSLAVAMPGVKPIMRRANVKTAPMVLRASSSSTLRCSGVGATGSTDVDMDASGSAPGAKDVAVTQAKRLEQMMLLRVRKLQELCKGDLALALDIVSASIRFLGLHGARVWEFGRCRNDFRAMLVKVAVILGIGAKLTTATDELVMQVWLCVVPASLVPRVRELELLAVNVCGGDAVRPSR
jgi:hypothetical protein